MTLKGANNDRLRFVLTWGLDQPELQSFFKLKKKALIQAGEKLQNLPEYPKDRIAAVLRFGAKANALLEKWCQEKVLEPNLIAADEIVARFEQVESGNEPLGDEEKRLLCRSIIVHLAGTNPSEVLVLFMQSQIGGGDESAEAEDEGVESIDTTVHSKELLIPAEDLSSLAAVMLTTRPSREAVTSSGNRDLLNFALAIRLASERYWDALAVIESELPEGSVYRNTLEKVLSSIRADSPHGVTNLPVRDVTDADEIDLDDIEVIAECTFVHQDGYVFFEPRYLLDSDGLIRCTKRVYTELFPDSGSVMAFTNQLSRVPDEHSLGAWSVERKETDKPVKVHVRSIAEPIFEVIDIGVSSDDYEAFRIMLSSPKYSSTGRPIFRTTDSLLVRPRRDVEDLVREGMKEPLDAWYSLNGFVTEGRTFVVGPLPPAKFTYDCSSLDQLLPRILSIGNDVEGVPRPTKAEIKAIVEVASETVAKVDPARLTEVRERIDQYLQASDSIQGILAQVIQNPKVQREIQEAKENASIQAMSGREDLKRDIRNLQVERAALEKSIRQRELEQQQLPAKIGRAVRKAFTKAKDEGIEGLGEVAVLAQLLDLGKTGVQSSAETNAKLEPELEWTQIEPEGGSLEDVLTKYGVSGERAPTVDSAIRISAAAGLVIVFRGVAANAMADATARVLASKPGASTTVTLGIYTQEQLREVISKLGESNGVLVLKMANHSDLSAYASELLDYAVKRAADKKGDAPLVILTLSDGPSALPVPARLRSLSICIDLDEISAPAAASGPSDLRDVIEEHEKSSGRKLWTPIRKKLVDAFDAHAKKPANDVAALLKSAFVEHALNDD